MNTFLERGSIARVAPESPDDTQWTHEELIWRNRQLTVFHRISEIMLRQGAEETRFDLIAREVGHMAGFPIVSIELCDFDRAVMIYRGLHGITLEGMPTPFEIPMDVSLSGQVAYSGEPLVETNAVGRREYASPIMQAFGIKSFICVPIKTNGKVIGTLSLAHKEQTEIEMRVMTALTSLANYLASLIDRLQARDAVRHGEAELASVYDRAPNIMCLFDDRLRIIRANHAAATFIGRSPKELASMRAVDFFHCTASKRECADNSNTPVCSNCELRRVVTETLATGRTWHQVRVNHSRIRANSTEDSILLVSAERIQVAGTQRVLLCIEDITHSVRADEQIRSQAALLEITRDAIFVRDFCDRILYWNEGAHGLYGWSTAEARGKTTAELGFHANPTEAAQALNAVQKDEAWTGEMRHKARDGRELIVQSRWTLVRENGGPAKAILVVNTDMSERKMLEAQLLRAQRLESIGTLASGLAHDLNNVLAPILMSVGILREQAKDDQTRTWLRTLEACSQRGADIVRQVLTFARGVEGARVLVDPRHLMKDMARIARETFPRSIEVHEEMNKNSLVVRGDSTQIQQVLMNLCVNARDAMPHGGTMTLKLEAEHLDAEAARRIPQSHPGDYVVISVSDTGTGIPPDLLDKIFDPFFTTKPLGQGTGLGLPSVLGIAKSHGGFVDVRSEVGRGTTFKVYLPASSDAADSGLCGPGNKEIPKGNGETVLVVDDEPAVRKIANAVLLANGYQAVMAGDGAEAVATFEKHRGSIKLVVSDMMMPRMDGPTALRAMRQLDPELKCVMITGLGEESRTAEATAAGAQVVLHKPFAADQLLRAVSQLLSAAR